MSSLGTESDIESSEEIQSSENSPTQTNHHNNPLENQQILADKSESEPTAASEHSDQVIEAEKKDRKPSTEPTVDGSNGLSDSQFEESALKDSKLSLDPQGTEAEEKLNALNTPKKSLQVEKNSSVIDINEHPLVGVEKRERDISVKLGGQVNLDEKFVVMNYKQPESNKNSPYITCSNVDVITKNCFPGDNDKLPMHGSEDWGQPKSLSILPNKYIAVGTSKGLILIFNHIFTRIQKFGSSKEREYGAVTCIDISPKEEDVVSVYENGKIVLWSMAKNERLKVIDPPEKGPVINVKFYKEVSEHFLLSTSSGTVYLYKVESIFFQWKVDKKPLNLQDETRDIYPSIPSGFFNIQIFPKTHQKITSYAKLSIAAFASMKEIIVVILEPLIILYRTKRPTGLRDIVIPCLSWGRGAVPGDEDNVNPVLAYSWGKEVYLLQLQINDNRKSSINEEEKESKVAKENVKIVGYFTAKEDISALHWISMNTLVAYNSYGEFISLASKKFSPTNPPPKGFDYSQVISSKVTIEDEIRYQMFNDSMMSGIPQNSVMFFEHTIRNLEFTKNIYIMGKKKMLMLKHFSWQEYLDELCKKNEWLTAMSVCASLFKGENNQFSEVPNNVVEKKNILKNYAVELTKKFIMSLEDQNRSAPMSLKAWSSTVDTVIDFLICTENFQYLFTAIPDALELFNIKELFLESIEPFILRGRVKALPNEAFREIVRFFTEKKKIDTLQYLVINLSTKDIDMDYAIILCMQHNLLTALMYLCSHKSDADGPDVLTPIASALGKYQRSLIEDKPEQTREYGLKFLWFVHMVLNGRLFPDGALTQEQWEVKVKDIIILLFDETNIDLVLKIDAYVAFEILEILFRPTTASLICSYDESTINLVGDEKSLNQGNNTNSDLRNEMNKFIASTQNKLQGQILGLIYYCSKKNEAYYNHLYYFLANLRLNLHCALPLDVMDETVLYILEHAYCPPTWSPSSSQSPTTGYKSLEEILSEERAGLIIGLLKDIENFLTAEELHKITEKAEELGLIDVRGFLYAMGKEFEKGFDLYLSQASPKAKRKIFKWLKEVIRRILPNEDEENEDQDEEAHKEFDRFKQILLTKLYDLVPLSSENTRKMILSLESSDFEVEVVNHLKDNPSLQLEYLNEVVSTREEYDLIPNELLVLHIDLLCQLNPKQVVNELKNNNYPLDACLELLTKYNIQDAHALLLERTGHTQEALDIHLDLFKETLDKKIAKIEKSLTFNSRKLTQKFENISFTCNEYIKAEDDDSEDIWLSVLDGLLMYYEDLIEEKANGKKEEDEKKAQLKEDCYKEFKHTYINYIASFVEEMSKNVKIRRILQKLQSCKAIELSELKDAFVAMLKGHYCEMTILTKAEGLVSEDTNRKMKFLYTTRGSGVQVDLTKVHKDDYEDIVTYCCGHTFPKRDQEGITCHLCVESEATKVDALIHELSTKGLRALKNRVSPSKVQAKTKDKKKEVPKKDEKKKKLKATQTAEFKNKCLSKLEQFDEWRKWDPFNLYGRNEEESKEDKPFGSFLSNELEM